MEKMGFNIPQKPISTGIITWYSITLLVLLFHQGFSKKDLLLQSSTMKSHAITTVPKPHIITKNDLRNRRQIDKPNNLMTPQENERILQMHNDKRRLETSAANMELMVK